MSGPVPDLKGMVGGVKQAENSLIVRQRILGELILNAVHERDAGKIRMIAAELLAVGTPVYRLEDTIMRYASDAFNLSYGTAIHDAVQTFVDLDRQARDAGIEEDIRRIASTT